MIIALILSSVLLVIWLLLLFMVENEEWVTAARAQLLANRLAIEKLQNKEREERARLQQYQGFQKKFMKLFIGGSKEKEIRKLQKNNRELQQGDFKNLKLYDMPGYVLFRKLPMLHTSGMYRRVRAVYFEIYGKKYPDLLSQRLFAKLLSYPFLGLALVLVLGTIIMTVGNITSGLGVMLVGAVLVLVLVYAMYDEILDLANKRRDAIVRQFPNVVSKLALLVTAGMIMNRAWKETAESGEGELYIEMRKTAEEMDNLIRPEEAYSTFIDRCNTKETTKLASAILQNMSKGNSEMVGLLKQMSEEAWNERRNLAKRDSENANSKLMIPTMLMFGSILIMIMVPVVMSFTGL